jgi:hypothetical protein
MSVSTVTARQYSALSESTQPPLKYLNIDQIAQSLYEVQENFDTLNAQLDMAREPMTERLVQNMLSAFRYLDSLVDHPGDLFSTIELGHLLELNHRVLCGEDPGTRAEFYMHMLATEEKFHKYIGWLKAWYRKHLPDPVYKRAAGVYVGILMQPQLFIEGNHRTGSLIASLELLRAGEPPFVLNRDNAIAYFNPSTVIKFSDRRHYNVSLFKIPGIKKRFGKFLRSNARPNYLLSSPPAGTAGYSGTAGD